MTLPDTPQGGPPITLERATESLSKVAPTVEALLTEAGRFREDLLRISELPDSTVPSNVKWKCLSHVAILNALVAEIERLQIQVSALRGGLKASGVIRETIEAQAREETK